MASVMILDNHDCTLHCVMTLSHFL